VKQPQTGLRRLLALAAIHIVICGFGVIEATEAQEISAVRSKALSQWPYASSAEALRKIPPGTELPPPSVQAIERSLNLVSTSPLTGSGMQQPAAGAGGSPPPSGGGSNQSLPPIEIQLPPHPPESQAPPAQWRPPIELPNPSTIPSPPLSQAPPNPSAGASGRSPIEPLTIPLPPHPPESQAPWNQRR
jgi:hypothetical protein